MACQRFGWQMGLSELGLTEVVRHEGLILEGVLRADGNDGLRSAQGLETLRPADRLPPSDLLFYNMEQGDGIAQTA